MSGNLYGFEDDEILESEPEDVVMRAIDEERKAPITFCEWTSKPLRSFVRVDTMLEHVIEFQLEEMVDPHGYASEKLVERAEDPEVVAAFEAALDLMFEGVAWRWADQQVATWHATWDEADPPAIHLARTPK